ncbi:MAG: OB-fold domain-containing protein [Myxococcota bacterium]
MMQSIVKTHYQALAKGQLRAHQCKRCRHITFPMTTACEECASYEYDEITLSGRGTLLFASHGVAPPPHPRFAALAPYVYGHVQLAEGVIAQGIVKNVEATPEGVAKLYGKLPLPVVVDVLETADLPVIAFKVAS